MKSITKNLYDAICYSREHPQYSNSEVAKKFGVDRHSIASVSIENYKFTDGEKYYWITEEEQAPVLCFYDSNESLTAVAKKYKTKPDTIKRRMAAMGLQYTARYKRQFNRQAFSGQINEEEAYWLGFLLADGYINEDRGFLKIKLGVADENHLIKFGTFMQEKEIKEKLQYEIGGAYAQNNICVSLEYDSRELINTLKKFNLFQNKSGKEIPYHFENFTLQKAYVRGMIDGDGHIQENFIKYVGSLESCEYIKKFFGKWVNYDPNCKYIYKQGAIYSFELRRKELLSIIENLYQDSKIYLDRKYTIAVSKSRN